MKVTERVLSLLENNKGEYISGEQIACEIGCSRNAVWKAVNSLKKKGYEITAVTNKGYALSEQNQIVSAQSIEKHLNHNNIRVVVKDSVTSTMTLCKELCEKGEAEGLLLVAKEQTQGKGRLGRSFISKDKTGIYFSLILRPYMSPQDSLLITTCAAVAVARAIEKHSGKGTKIKWVNDIFIDDKKVCGILTEASFDMETGRLAYAVLGIGINVYFDSDTIPEEIKDIAGSVFDNENYDSEAVSKIVADTVNFFMEEYSHLTKKQFFTEYEKRMYLTGKRILVIKPDETKSAIARGIDNSFRLLVEYENGESEYLSTGEVSTKIN